ncbi:sulfotransferase family protein [Thalassotalea euphylliae]|uniref:Sulfotransferase family protein n=2 Tax=Thalassotalea euphylliae TaxID=1655234 RepID=A0A3E0TY55_9GAMM|nr:sulfotransferase family protein [Thalassotalea euphylliae]
MHTSKIWIIGLPRTATTSICVTMLELGFKTAHTAYLQRCFDSAQVIADTPVFCDYQALDKQYPNSKFIYLTRSFDKWLPSIRQLLSRMYTNLQRGDGGFNPHLKRCFNDVFSPLTENNIASDEFLIQCYTKHQQGIHDYFKHREQDLLTLDIAASDSFAKLIEFLGLPQDTQGEFPLINMKGKVTAWNKINHPLKVASTNNGRIDSRFAYQLI